MENDTEITFDRYKALARLVKCGNLYKTYEGQREAFWRPYGPHVDHAYNSMPHGVGIADDDDVGWLVTEGLALRSEHDPMLCLGKVVPTTKAADRLENHGLTPESKGVRVHLEHCCALKHGCKYGSEFCPVETKMLPPSYEKCGACSEEEEDWAENLVAYESEDLAEELRGRGFTVTKVRETPGSRG